MIMFNDKYQKKNLLKRYERLKQKVKWKDREYESITDLAKVFKKTSATISYWIKHKKVIDGCIIEKVF